MACPRIQAYLLGELRSNLDASGLFYGRNRLNADGGTPTLAEICRAGFHHIFCTERLVGIVVVQGPQRVDELLLLFMPYTGGAALPARFFLGEVNA